MTVLGAKSEGRSFFCSGAALVVMSLLTLFFVIKYPDVTIDYVQRGLKLSVGVIIPSLFPFMVASELIVSSGAVSYLSKVLDAPSRRLFGVGGEGAGAFILGIFCGFPVGTRTAVSLYKRGKIDSDELSRLVCFSNNPSSAFVISAVGTTLFGCHDFGVVLYFITIFSSFLVGISQNILLSTNKKSARRTFVMKDETNSSVRGISTFSTAVTSSAFSMVGICGFVVFFSAFTGVLGEIMAVFCIPDLLRAILFSFFELTVGVASGAGVRPINVALLIAAFAVGWSGLSVHFQMISVCDGLKIPLGRYFLSKLSQGSINVILVWLYLTFFGNRLVFDAKSVGAFLNASEDSAVIVKVVCITFLASLFVGVLCKIKNAKNDMP